MENHYETICIIRPDAGDDTVKAVVQKASGVVEAQGGRINKVEEWGRRRLAYPIKKKNEGFYFLMDYASAPGTVAELERVLRNNEDVFRYQTVKVIQRKQKQRKTPAPAEVKGGANGKANG
ncbi:MAG: 30S ribosomal protein S6 [Deltaproteobacteria bacterium]|nr:30S ribosomal protein S6 [Deltaproteobacteria bacterium]